MFEVFASCETEPDFVSKCIMKATDADFSHVGIIVDGKTIWHATGKGFHCMPVDEFTKDHIFVHRFEVEVPSRDYALGWLQGNNGKAYSKSQYPGFLIDAFKELGDDGERELICSEAVALFGVYCCELALKVDPDFVDPKQAIKLMHAVKVGA